MIQHETAILGAGIGGLTTAVALTRQGIPCTVYEAGPAEGPLGGGLMLAHNGMQVMQRLGLREAVERVGYSIQRFGMTDARLTMLRDISFAELDAHYGLGHVAIKRAKLRQLLLAALPAGTVHYGMRSEAVDNADYCATVRFANGDSIQAAKLIAADGLHSATRRALLPHKRPRFCGQAAWTGICHGPIPPELAQTIEAWGPHASRMVVTPVGPDEIYWVAVTDAAPGAVLPLVEVQALLDAHYHPRLAALPRNSDPAGNYSWQFYDLRDLAPWHVGRTVFLGDAAHATTPNLEQGANQAMEDALRLAQLLTRSSYGVEATYREYHRSRRVKVRKVIDASHQWGRLAHWRHPWARVTRDALLCRLPQYISMALQKQLAHVADESG